MSAEPRAGSRSSAWMAVAALIVAALATPFGGGIGGTDFGQLVHGPLEVRTSEGWAGLADGAAVPTDRLVRAAGEEVRIAVGGTELTLADGAELATDRDVPELLRGSLLVDTDRVWTVRLGAARVEGRGEWRLDTGVASRVATYRGRVELDDGAREVSLPRYRQVPVRNGALEDGRRPLRYLVGDAWDERLLAAAFAVDRLAVRLVDSLARSHGEQPRSPEFYAAFASVDGVVEETLDALAATEEDGRFGPPAEVLLGVAVADALARGAELELDAATDRLIDLRRAGATWGLVLVEHDLTTADLRAAADRALERVEASPPPAEPGPQEAAEPEAAEPADDPGGTASSEPSEPAPTPAPEAPPSSSPSPSPSSGESGEDDGGGPLEPVEDTVRDVGDTVGDLIGGTGDTVGDVVGGVDGLLR